MPANSNAAPSSFQAIREGKHDRRNRRFELEGSRSGFRWSAAAGPEGSAVREAPGEGCRRLGHPRSVQRLDHPRQPCAVQFLHHRHGEERHPRLPRRKQQPRRQRGGVHRHRRQGVLHRRQHQGVRRVLRRQPAGIPPVHAPVQRHGLDDSRLRQAGDLPGQRHARRWRPGNRHGLRLLHRPGSRPLRPGRPQARLGGDRRRHRLPAGDDRRRAVDGLGRPLRTFLGPQGLPARDRRRRRPRPQGRRPVRSQSDGVDRPDVRRMGPVRPRRAQDRRGGGGGQGADGDAVRSISAGSTRGSSSSAASSFTPSPTA